MGSEEKKKENEVDAVRFISVECEMLRNFESPQLPNPTPPDLILCNILQLLFRSPPRLPGQWPRGTSERERTSHQASERAKTLKTQGKEVIEHEKVSRDKSSSRRSATKFTRQKVHRKRTNPKPSIYYPSTFCSSRIRVGVASRHVATARPR